MKKNTLKNKGVTLYRKSKVLRKVFRNKLDFVKFNEKKTYKKNMSGRWYFLKEYASFWGRRMYVNKKCYHISLGRISPKTPRKKIKINRKVQKIFKNTVIRRLVDFGRNKHAEINLNLLRQGLERSEKKNNSFWNNRFFSKQNLFRSRVIGKIKGHLIKQGKKKKAQKSLYTALLVVIYRYRASVLLALSELSARCRPTFVLRRFVRRRKI